MRFYKHKNWFVGTGLRDDKIIIFFNNTTDSAMTAKELNLLTDQNEILKALLQSKKECTSIGIRAAAFGEDLIVTCVEDIIVEDGQTTIILKHFDSRGYILPSHKLNLLEILAVHPFATAFENPYLSTIDRQRTWFF